MIFILSKKKTTKTSRMRLYNPWGVLIGPLMSLQGGPCLLIHGVLFIFVMDLSLLFRSVLMILSWVLCLLLLYLCNFSASNKYLSLINKIKKRLYISLPLASQSSKVKTQTRMWSLPFYSYTQHWLYFSLCTM
jgi:hypothetical protein